MKAQRHGTTGRTLVALLVVALVAVGCAAPKRPPRPAPVVDRTPATSVPAPLPGSENAGKPGYYTVRTGDTLYRIGLEQGQSWRDIAAWNGIANPNVIEVGQVLRVVPPESVTAATATTPAPAPAAAPAAAGPVTTQPVAGASVQARPLDSTSSAPAPAATTAAKPAAPSAPAPAAADDRIALIWPANGPVLYNFDETRSKGVGIGGRAGEPVLAAADGRVVYAGSDLRGYGNLVILKHNNTFLTAYAHNQALLVREDQTVRQGQKIAEMGSSDADRVKLHFEVRRQGKPVDPMSLLPNR